jgi:hypothetical protein
MCFGTLVLGTEKENTIVRVPGTFEKPPVFGAPPPTRFNHDRLKEITPYLPGSVFEFSPSSAVSNRPVTWKAGRIAHLAGTARR